MNATLSFCIRHPLHAMYSRFELERSVHVFSRNINNNFLVPSYSSFGEIHQFGFPALFLAIAHVHPVKVAGKQGGLVSACPAPDLQISSQARRVGKACVITCTSRCPPHH